MNSSGPVSPAFPSAAALAAVLAAILGAVPRVSAQPEFSPEFPLHEPASAFTYQSSPMAASDGRVFLVVWTEFEGENRIMAARIRARDRAVLDPDGIFIAGFESYQCFPSVASDGTGFLIVWEDLGGATGSDVLAARVSGADSAAAAVSRFTVTAEPGDQTSPVVASNGSGFLVAWEAMQGSSMDIRAALLAGGEAAAAGPTGPSFTVAGGDFHSVRPAAASAGGGYLVAWEDYRNVGIDIFAARVAGDGTLLDAEALPVCAATGDQIGVALASNGRDYLAAWEDIRMRGAPDIYAARIRGADGSLPDPLGIALATAPGYQVFPTAASSGGDFLVAWEDYRSGGAAADIRGTRLRSSDGSLLEADIALQASADAQYSPALASVPGRYLLSYQSPGTAGYDFRIRALTADFEEDADGDGVADRRDNCPGAPNPGQEDRDGDGMGDACEPFMEVDIDVDPHSRKNYVRLHCGQWVQVAIYGSRLLDATQVDPASVTFAGARPKMNERRTFHTIRDLDRDGRPDIYFKFRGEHLDLDHESESATLEGRLFDGTAIQGSDRIKVVRW
jgi:hypothetical protein